MVSDIDLGPVNSRLARKMLVANLLVLTAVLLVFSVAVYWYSMSQAYGELKDALQLFAVSLISSIDPGETEPDIVSPTRSNPTTMPLSMMGIEWYSLDGKLLAVVGAVKIKTSFNKSARYQLQQDPASLLLTQPAVVRGNLMGYLRIGHSLARLDRESAHLISGLAVGVLSSMLVSGVGVFWLTTQSLAPMETAFLRLTKFTDDASHELRTPLMAMKSNLELVLRRANLEPQYRDKLLTIEQIIDHTTKLVDGMLALARGDKQQIGKSYSKVDLCALINEVTAELKATAEEKQIDLTCNDQKQLFVKGDHTDLHRILENILHNAIFYTNANGKVDLVLKQEADKAIIEIRDTGIGIAESDLPHIFERFWRADTARSRQAGGSGLGLSIAKSIAFEHGGTIEATSKPSFGSCFTITLPIASKHDLPPTD
jgi:signal transduction histidine kinase